MTLGVMTPSRTTLCIMTISIMTLSIIMLSVMKLNRTTFRIMKLSITTFSIMTLSIASLGVMTLVITTFRLTTFSEMPSWQNYITHKVIHHNGNQENDTRHIITISVAIGPLCLVSSGILSLSRVS
jgi:hypothetical protein